MPSLARTPRRPRFRLNDAAAYRAHQLLRATLCAATGIMSITCIAQSLGDRQESIVAAVRSICSASGTTEKISVDGQGTVAVTLSGGKANGAVVLSRSQWNGIEGMQHHPEIYEKCVEFSLPVFLSNFRPYVRVTGNSKPLIQSRYLSEEHMKAEGCQEASDSARELLWQNCGGPSVIAQEGRCSSRSPPGSFIFTRELVGFCRS